MVTIENLRMGMEKWGSTSWPLDFHNRFYSTFSLYKKDGLTEDWWSWAVDSLWNWGAIRPWSKDEIRERGLKRLQQLADEYMSLRTENAGQEPTIELVDWNRAYKFYELAYEIKGYTGQVFPAKLCHFILPSIFPVTDNAMAPNEGSYESYWCLCKEEWAHCSDKDALKEVLRNEIAANTYRREVIPDYPWPTKIFELCVIGIGGIKKA